MQPIIFQIGDFAIRGYGLMAALGFMAGIWIASREAERLGENKERTMDMAFYMVLAAIIGSRVLHVLVEWKYFSQHPGEIIKIWEGGLVFYGGLIGAVIVGSWYIWKHSMPFWKTADIFAVGIPLGHAFGRMGCFLAGCCYGYATDLPWAVEFSNPDSLAPLHEHLHPTQLYSSLNNLTIFSILFLMRKGKKFDGQLALTYVFLYSITRGIIELFRGDDRGTVYAGYISTAQGIGIVLAISAIFAMVYLNKKAAANKG